MLEFSEIKPYVEWILERKIIENGGPSFEKWKTMKKKKHRKIIKTKNHRCKL